MTDQDSALVNEKIKQFFAGYPLRSVVKGQILLYPDDEPRGVMYIVNGQVRKYDVTYKGNTIIISIYRAGSLLPLTWALNQTPNTFFFEAGTNLLYHTAPREDAIKFFESNADVTLELLARSYQLADSANGRMVHSMTSDAHTRLLFELVNLSYRIGTINREGAYTIRINETDLAAHTGLSRETVSREMSKLKKEKRLESSRTNIVIHDLAYIQEQLLHKPD